ncbi:MAG: CoA ester lyase [Pseudomonadota bacterium]
MDIQHCKTFLFVPANRPERINKALASGADAVIVDLEDAVAPDAKDAARQALGTWLSTADVDRPVLVRVNGVDTPWHAADLAVCRASGVAAVMLPKAESPADLRRVHATTQKPILPIIESAWGVHHVLHIAQAPGCARLVFGKLDLAIDLGLEQADDDHEEQVFQPYRAPLVLASRLAGLAPPVDGVYTALGDDLGLAAYARRARRDGFGSLLLIHPRQVAAVATAWAPIAEELAWARRVMAASVEASGNAAAVDGRMVDAPVIARAQRLLAAVC